MMGAPRTYQLHETEEWNGSVQIVLAEDHAQLVAANKRLTDACADIAKDRAEYFTKHEQLVALVKAWADAKKAYDANDNLSWSIRKSRHKRFMAAEVALLQATRSVVCPNSAIVTG